jgi:hypothetical protein
MSVLRIPKTHYAIACILLDKDEYAVGYTKYYYDDLTIWCIGFKYVMISLAWQDKNWCPLCNCGIDGCKISIKDS